MMSHSQKIAPYWREWSNISAQLFLRDSNQDLGKTIISAMLSRKPICTGLVCCEPFACPLPATIQLTGHFFTSEQPKGLVVAAPFWHLAISHGYFLTHELDWTCIGQVLQYQIDSHGISDHVGIYATRMSRKKKKKKKKKQWSKARCRHLATAVHSSLLQPPISQQTRCKAPKNKSVRKAFHRESWVIWWQFTQMVFMTVAQQKWWCQLQGRLLWLFPNRQHELDHYNIYVPTISNLLGTHDSCSISFSAIHLVDFHQGCGSRRNASFLVADGRHSWAIKLFMNQLILGWGSFATWLIYCTYNIMYIYIYT